MIKPPILMIHGSTGQGGSWKDVISHLDDDWRTITPTLTGHGRGQEPTELEIAEITDHVLSNVELPDEPIFLVGHSFGGNICLELALRDAFPITGIAMFEPVLINCLLTAGLVDIHTPMRDYMLAYVKDYEGGNTKAVGTMIDYWFGMGAFEAMPDFMRDFLVATTAANIRDVKSGLRRYFDADELARFQVPITIAYGTASPPAFEEIANAVVACVGNGKAVPIEGANHAMLADHPADVAKFISSF